jgi:four helix bundle protein
MKQDHPAVELKERTRSFALRIIRLVRALPAGIETRVVGQQLLRSGTAAAANYRAACRSRSRAEFIAKISIALEEADESAFWLELLADAEIIPPVRLTALRDEANQLAAIFNASRNTARQNGHKPALAADQCWTS